jgi:serine/threonine protein kinase
MPIIHVTHGLDERHATGSLRDHRAARRRRMGEVYRARDTRLERTVAIKILPEAFSSDSDRLQRLHQEARVLSALNHPNLLAIYDVGRQGSVHYLVSEFLEGQTLRTRIENCRQTRLRRYQGRLQVPK